MKPLILAGIAVAATLPLAAQDRTERVCTRSGIELVDAGDAAAMLEDGRAFEPHVYPCSQNAACVQTAWHDELEARCLRAAEIGYPVKSVTQVRLEIVKASRETFFDAFMDSLIESESLSESQLLEVADALEDPAKEADLEPPLGTFLASLKNACGCPYDTNAAGERCEDRSRYVTSLADAPLCYPSDVTDGMLEDHKRANPRIWEEIRPPFSAGTAAASGTAEMAVPVRPAVYSPARSRSFGPGTFLVGIDVPPGTYRSRPDGSHCYWARLSGLGGTLDDIIANEGVNSGQAIVEIASSDYAFQSSGCVAWTRVDRADSAIRYQPPR